MHNDQSFVNPYMQQYFSSLDQASNSAFFDVFSQTGAKVAANTSKLMNSGDLVELSLDRLYQLSDISDAEGISADRADLGRDPVNVVLIERLLSEMVAPMGLGRIREAYTALVDQELTEEQVHQFFQLLAPVVCEALGNLVKMNGLNYMNDNTVRLAFYEGVVSLFQSGHPPA